MKINFDAGGAMLFGLIFAIPGIVSIPLLAYHFLIFPNFDGFMQDLSIYNYDGESQHFLYWSGFWFITLVFSIAAIMASKD